MIIRLRHLIDCISHTNDLRYESNDSRDILNGSFSVTALRSVRCEDCDVDVVVRLKKFDFSFAGGDGCRNVRWN
jgi:hypothetical protein